MSSPTSNSTAKRTVDFFVPIVLLAWFFFMAYYVVNVGHFLYDEAYFYDRAVTAITGEQIVVFGPFISGSQPTAYTPGGALFYLMGLPFWFTKNPLAGMYWVILSSCIGAFILDRTLRKFDFSPIFRGSLAVLGTWGFWHAYLADRLWNVDMFWISVSIFFSLVLHAAHGKNHRQWLAFALGCSSAVILQIHLGALVALAISGIYIWSKNKAYLTKRHLVFATAGGLLLYAPYLAHDAANGFFNLRHMSVPGATRSATYQKAFLTLFKFTNPIYEHATLEGWQRIAQIFVIISTSFLIVVGLLRSGISRIVGFSALILLPLFFALAKRNFEHHYVTSVVPLLFLVPAGGAEWIWTRSKVSRVALVAYFLAFVAINAYLITIAYNRGTPHHVSTTTILKDAEKWNDGGVLIVKPNDADNFTRYVIAKNYLGGVKKVFKTSDGVECFVTFGHPSGQRDVPIGPGTFYSCP